MSKTVVYDPVTGEILRVTACATGVAYLQKDGDEAFLIAGPIDDIDDATHYVDLVEDEVREKAVVDTVPSTLTPLVGEVVEISLPEPADVQVTGMDGFRFRYRDEDGLLQLQFDTPGEYRVKATMIRHISEEVVIDVSAN